MAKAPARRRSPSRRRTRPARWRRSASSSWHFAKLAVAAYNKADGIHVTLGQNDTGLTPALAVTKTQAIIASPAVAVVGPAGSQEVEAVGPLFKAAGMAFISGSATNSTLTTSGANPTFFRVVAPDSVQGPQDANYIIKHKLQAEGRRS